MKFIHIGDAHIREQTWANIPEVRGDALSSCSKVAEYAENNGISTLVLSGDVFHSSKPTSKDIDILSVLLSAFDEVLYIEGNHEKSSPPWLSVLTNSRCTLTQLSTEPAVRQGVQFFGIDYTRSSDDTIEQVNKVVDSYDTENSVLVMHCGFRHMINFEGASQIDVTKTAGFKGTILVSHVHKRKTYKNVHSPGPLFPQSWEEVGPCFVDVIDTDKWSIEALDITVRSYRTIDISEVPEFKDTPMELPTLVRVRTSDPKDVIPTIEGCIVVPVITGKASASTGTQDIQLDGMTIDDAIRAEYEDPEDGNIMVDLFHAASPEKYMEKLLNDNNIDRRSL